MLEQESGGVTYSNAWFGPAASSWLKDEIKSNNPYTVTTSSAPVAYNLIAYFIANNVNGADTRTNSPAAAVRCIREYNMD
jgi:hypothetical protein